MKKKAFILGVLLSYPAFAGDYDYEALSGILDNFEDLKASNPEASLDELDVFLKRQLAGSVGGIRESDTDLDYAGIIDNILSAVANQSLTEAEKALFNGSPVRGLSVINAGRKAKGRSIDLYKPSVLLNGNGDAFRHCYWNELMVQTTDEAFAKSWGEAHEESANNPQLEKIMDLRNNADGRRFAVRYPNENEDERSARCVRAVDDKKLVRIIVNGLYPTDTDGKI